MCSRHRNRRRFTRSLASDSTFGQGRASELFPQLEDESSDQLCLIHSLPGVGELLDSFVDLAGGNCQAQRHEGRDQVFMAAGGRAAAGGGHNRIFPVAYERLTVGWSPAWIIAVCRVRALHERLHLVRRSPGSAGPFEHLFFAWKNAIQRPQKNFPQSDPV